jgi:hypothetical protein
MFHQVIPHGPAPDAGAKSSPDRTQILDPRDYWQTASSCPDWPRVSGTRRYDGPVGKVGAEQRLEAIGSYLNRGASTLHVPTSDERASEFARIFKHDGGTWYSLGINNLSPLGRLAEGEADLIVEACHIRGYLRKLEAQAVRDAEAKEQAKLSEARRTLENYRTTALAEIEEINSLAEAAARHEQRLADEQAAARTRMLRQHVGVLHSAAVGAAHTLGLSVPDAPDFL